MKAQLVTLSAAALIFASGAAKAADRQSQAYAEQATAAAAEQLRTAGVAVPDRGLALRATVGADGRLNAVRVIRTSGSLEADLQVARALRLLKVERPPSHLAGADLTLRLDRAAVAVAAN